MSWDHNSCIFSFPCWFCFHQRKSPGSFHKHVNQPLSTKHSSQETHNKARRGATDTKHLTWARNSGLVTRKQLLRVKIGGDSLLWSSLQSGWMSDPQRNMSKAQWYHWWEQSLLFSMWQPPRRKQPLVDVHFACLFQHGTRAGSALPFWLLLVSS